MQGCTSSMKVSAGITIALWAASGFADSRAQRKICTVQASGINATDDAPAIRAAFQKCGRHGRVVFDAKTYYVNSVLNITGLEDVDIDVHGQLLVVPVLQLFPTEVC